jgi:hypothetical protein
MHRRKILFFLFAILLSLPSLAQIHDKEDFAVPKGFYFDPKPRPIRTFISNFNFGLSVGYGATFYSQQMNDFNILQDSEQGPIIYTGEVEAGDTLSSGISYWYNRINYAQAVNDNSEFRVGGDSTDLRYKSLSHSIPISLSVHYDFKNYKIGAGVMLEYHVPREFRPNQFQDQLGTIEPDFKRAFLQRYYGILGVRIFRYWQYLAGIDAKIGVMRFDKNFDRSLESGIFVNLGFPVEREFSEYFRAYVRPSFDYKNYTLNIPESANNVPTSMNAIMIEFGIFYRIPELPKCFHKKCRTQVNHMHGEYEYRSRVHPFYKYQNPHHGQNYPVLIKYKGRNKKKLNPY